MTFQTLILTGPESNLRAPWSLLSGRLKYRQVVHNVSCLLLYYKARQKTREKKNEIKSSVLRFSFRRCPGSGANPHQYNMNVPPTLIICIVLILKRVVPI